MVCPSCNGTGFVVDGPHYTNECDKNHLPCNVCDGKGIINEEFVDDDFDDADLLFWNLSNPS